MRYAYYVLSPDSLKDLYSKLPTEIKLELQDKINELSAITKHDSLSARLVFEEGLKNGYLLSFMEKMSDVKK